ncbi:MAG: ABC transporter ATP-binding protein [Clostridiales bacterium]|nr:ABC transporter ATP-binding protein [Clostridiales bacterium]
MKKLSGFFAGIGEMMKILWQSSKSLTLLMIFNNLIRNAIWPLRALAVKNIVDIIVLSSENGFSAYQKSFWIYIILFFLCFLLNRIWWPLNSYTQTLMLAQISNKTKQRITAVMEKVHLSFFDYAENYDTYKRALDQTNDRQPINTVNNVIGFISLVISFVTAFSVMISISIPVTILLMISSIPAVIWEGRFNKKVYAFDKEATREKRLLEYLFSLFVDKASSKEIRTFKTDCYLSEKHESTLKEYNRKYFRLINSKIRVDSFFWLILQCTLMIGYFLIISNTGAGKIAIGSLSFFLAVAGDLQLAIKNFGSSFNNVIQSGKYFDNLLQFEKQVADDTDSVDYLNIPDTVETIEFRNVSFSYPNAENETLKDVSFTLRCPQSAVLVGENGAGKTTIMKLLLGFYKPTSGAVLINGVNIQKYRPEDYFRLFSVCFQDYMKYGFSLKENVVMSNVKIDEQKFNEIVNETGLKDIIEDLPDKELTCLSREYDENGVELSGGQYNRIAIARATAKNAPIILFDEPNAALDAKAERNLFRLYAQLTKDKLGIMITHRLSTAVNSDLILVLKDGKLIECGNHSELLINNGEYAALFNMQAKHYMSNEGADLK